MINFDGDFSLSDGHRAINQCPLCNGPGSQLEARLLGETGERQTIFIHCRACQGSLIAFFSLSGPGISSYGLVTDLSFDDIIKFKRRESIELDDVIYAHENLKSPHFLAKINRS